MTDRLFQIVADTLGLPVGDISMETSAQNTPAWDSVTHLNLILSIEQEFGQRFSPDEFMQMQGVAAIERMLAARGAT